MNQKLSPPVQLQAASSQSNPKYSCLPRWVQKNPHFTGRKSLLKSIREKLCDTAPKEYNHRLALFGMGGVGKTQIAIQYLVQYEAEYEGVYWITAETKAQLLSGFVSIAKETRCTDTTSQTQIEVAEAVLRWFDKSKDWLLVVDNLDEINIAYGYLPRLKSGGGHVLITTRNPNSPDIPAEGLRVDIHEPEEAKEMLLQRAQLRDEIGTGSAVEEEARLIVRSLGFLALAVEQAAAYVRVELAKDIFKFRSTYAVQRRKLHGRESSGNTYYKNTVATTWILSMKAIQSQNAAAVQLLKVFAFMNPDGITHQFLGAAQNVLSSVLQSNDSTTFNSHLTDALADLERFSLIFRPSSDLIRIHRLVQSVIKDQMTMDELENHRNLVCIVGLYGFPEFEHAIRTTCRNRESEIIAIIFEITEMKSEDAARLMARVGRYFQHDGKASEAAPLLSNAHTVFEIVKGKEAADTLRTMVNLAGSYRLLGRVKEAAEMEEKVVEARSRILGEEHPDTLWAMGNLALSYRSLAKVKEAAEMEEKVVEARSRILGDEHPDTLWAMGNLAGSYTSLGKVKEAAEMEEKVVEAKGRILGEEHPDTLWAMGNLAASYASLGKVREAAEMEEKVVEARSRILGEEHPDTLQTMGNLALSYKSLGKVKEAAEMEEKMVEAQSRILGKEHSIQ